MSNFEIGFCTYSEFREGVPGRINEVQLCVNGLYVVMFALDIKSEIPAAKYPSQVTDLEPLDDNCYRVDFTIMNADLAADHATTAHFRDGYWLPARSQAIEVSRIPVISGYFKEDYLDEGYEQELQDMIGFENSKLAADDLVSC